MRSPRKPKLSAEKRRDLQVAAAVARETLLHTHVNQAIELIGLAGNRVSVMRMLDIYMRVNAVTPPDAELVSTRVLAMLGEESLAGERPRVYVEGEEGLAESLPFVGVVRDRLRGRALNDLRRWVELHTGRTQIALLDVYVAHALRFIAMLEETHGISAALRVFAEHITVPKALYDSLHFFVLDRLAADELPAPSEKVTPLAARSVNGLKPAPANGRRKRA